MTNTVDISWIEMPFATEDDARAAKHFFPQAAPDGLEAILIETVDGTRLFTVTNIDGGCCGCCGGDRPWPKRYAFLTRSQITALIERGLR